MRSIVSFASFVSLVLTLTLTACPGETPADAGTGDDDAGTSASGEDSGTAEDAGSGAPDAGDEDAGTGGRDAGGAVGDDAGSPADDAGVSSEAICGFNADCPANERCECDEVNGCRCLIGERGTGVNGVDTCSDGNDCESSLCIEGPGGDYYCSDECLDDNDCNSALPICSNIAFVGQVCIRDPDDA